MRARRQASLFVAALALLAACWAGEAKAQYGSVGTAAGYLPVGTTTIPASMLGVYGGVTIGSSYISTTAPTNGAIIQGNVGIGTTAPGGLYELDIVGGLNTIVRTHSVNATGTSGYVAENTSKSWFVGSNWTGAWSTNFEIDDLTAGGASRLVINTSGDVGIGTTSPGYLLDVHANSAVISIGDGTNTATSISMAGTRGVVGFDPTAGAYLQSSGGKDITLAAGSVLGSAPFIVKSTGNVGIGTTSPIQKLDVRGMAVFNYNGSSNGGNTYIDNNGTSGAARVYGYDGGGANLFMLNANGNSYFTGGSVGIGTTAPTTMLHIFNGGTSAQTFDGDNINGYAGSNFTIPRYTIGSGVVTYGGISFGHPSWGVAAVGGAAVGLPAIRTLGLYTSNGTVLTERVRVDTNGNVGIGTTVPDQKLQVVGGNIVIDNSQYYYAKDQSGTENAVLGYTSASNLQLLNRSANGGLHLGIANAGNANNIEFLVGNATEVMRITSAGNVGIGTTSPTWPLDVHNAGNSVAGIFGGSTAGAVGFGTVSSVPFIQGYTSDAASSATNLSLQPSGGNVGIGTTSPQATLDVNGYARLAKNTSQPVACSATNDGAIALTHLYTLCICNGGSTSWVQESNGTTSCSW